jgi:site-specific DNA-methyltransferase (adenine-specific)
VLVPYYRDAWATLYRGECMAALRELPSGSVGAIITDPPYSSGGMMRSDRMRGTVQKYQSSDAEKLWAAFSGDNRDQHAYGYWCALWLSECLRIAELGALALLFTDWRQLPTTTDAFQAGGWIWRGICVWHKRGGRPRMGAFSNQAEYVVWGSKGPMRDESTTYLPGIITTGIARGDDKQHLTAKPTDLMEQLVQVAPEGSTILDPFMGSGSTGVSAKRLGRRFIGIEIVPEYCDVAASRMAQGVLLGEVV